MLHFKFSLKNPFHGKSPWRSIYQGEWLISKHTAFEIGVFKNAYELFNLEIDLNFKGNDHAGPSIDLTVLGWEFRVAAPDTRHWNYDKNRWVNYDDPEEVKSQW